MVDAPISFEITRTIDGAPVMFAHRDWSLNRYDPDYQPKEGDLVFRRISDKENQELSRRLATQTARKKGLPPEQRSALAAALVEKNAGLIFLDTWHDAARPDTVPPTARSWVIYTVERRLAKKPFEMPRPNVEIPDTELVTVYNELHTIAPVTIITDTHELTLGVSSDTEPVYDPRPVLTHKDLIIRKWTPEEIEKLLPTVTDVLLAKEHIAQVRGLASKRLRNQAKRRLERQIILDMILSE